jgi:hypothetical protein
MKKFKKLNRSEMKNVLGGDPPLPCVLTCSGGGGGSGTVRLPSCPESYIIACLSVFPNALTASCSCYGGPV